MWENELEMLAFGHAIQCPLDNKQDTCFRTQIHPSPGQNNIFINGTKSGPDTPKSPEDAIKQTMHS